MYMELHTLIETPDSHVLLVGLCVYIVIKYFLPRD